MLAVVVAVTGLATVDRRHRRLRLRRRHRRRAAVGRHDAVGGARHGPERDCRAADSTRPSRPTLMANAPLADAITYGFGDLGLILFLTWLGPKLMRADLKREAKELEAAARGGAEPAARSRSGAHYGVRAYQVENPEVGGLDRRGARAAASPRAAVGAARAARAACCCTLDPALTLQRGDRIVVSARAGRVPDAERDDRPGDRRCRAAVAAGARPWPSSLTNREVIGTDPGRALAATRGARRLPRSRCGAAPC